METFKAWKELIKAVKGISSAIEGENSEGGSAINDDTNYLVSGDAALVNKNLDTSKLAFDAESVKSLKPTKVGDMFTQEGVDIINSMLSNEIIKTEAVSVFVFVKDTSEGDLLVRVVELEFINPTNKYSIRFKHYSGLTSDKFTLDTPMYPGNI